MMGLNQGRTRACRQSWHFYLAVEAESSKLFSIYIFCWYKLQSSTNYDLAKHIIRLDIFEQNFLGINWPARKMDSVISLVWWTWCPPYFCPIVVSRTSQNLDLARLPWVGGARVCALNHCSIAKWSRVAKLVNILQDIYVSLSHCAAIQYLI